MIKRLLCRLLGHRWEVTVESIWTTDWYGEGQPWGDFVRCSRCGAPDPSWTGPFYPDEEG